MGQECPLGALPSHENLGLSECVRTRQLANCPWGGAEVTKPSLLYAAQAGRSLPSSLPCVDLRLASMTTDRLSLPCLGYCKFRETHPYRSRRHRQHELR